MNHLKFKAFNKLTKKIYPILKLNLDKKAHTLLDIYDEVTENGVTFTSWLEVYDEDIEILQFTNFSDKNNKDIYQNDIVRWGAHSIGIVKVVKGQWVFSNKNGDFSVFGYCKDAKIVGNSLTNLELIKPTDISSDI
jgi:uncharacterized phage protein (TIGR01671 family)